MTTSVKIAEFLDDILSTSTIPDYSPALNGLQLENEGEVKKIAAAVDFSSQTVSRAIDEKAGLLVIHHGMFWSGLNRFVGHRYRQLKALMSNNVAVYSSHIPLDYHPTFGNNSLLAQALNLKPDGQFGEYKNIYIGVKGTDQVETAELFRRSTLFAQAHGGLARSTPIDPAQITKRWAICTGSGASSETLREAASLGIDTMIVGEGPHHTAVEAMELGITVIYAGHYATETLGVRAISTHCANTFGLEATFIEAPTSL